MTIVTPLSICLAVVCAFLLGRSAVISTRRDNYCKLGADGWEIATCAGEDRFAAYLILKRETLHTSK